MITVMPFMRRHPHPLRRTAKIKHGKIKMMMDTTKTTRTPSPEVAFGWFGTATSFVGSVIFSFRMIPWMSDAVVLFLISNTILAWTAYRQQVWPFVALFLSYILLDFVGLYRW